MGEFLVQVFCQNNCHPSKTDSLKYLPKPEQQRDEYRFPAINEFTAPALFMSLFSLGTLFLIYNYFEDRPRSLKPPPKKKSGRQVAYDEVANGTACFGIFNIYNTCLYGCMVLNALTKGPMSCFETLGVEFAESRFGMERAEAGAIVATMGFIGACNLMAMGALSERFDDIQLTIAGIILFMTGILMNTFLDQDDIDNNPKWRYVVAMFFTYSIGYPICHTALIGLFSKSESKFLVSFKIKMYINFSHIIFLVLLFNLFYSKLLAVDHKERYKAGFLLQGQLPAFLFPCLRVILS